MVTESSGDSFFSSNGGQRVDFVSGPGCSSPNAINPGNVLAYVNLSCFAFPAAGQLGNLGRNTLNSPRLGNFDFSVFKNHNLIGEKLRIQFRAELFNLFNHRTFGVRQVTAFNSSGVPQAVSAQLTSPTVTNSRQLQFGLKLVF